jgi:hypothetical protein
MCSKGLNLQIEEVPISWVLSDSVLKFVGKEYLDINYTTTKYSLKNTIIKKIFKLRNLKRFFYLVKEIKI